MRASRPFIIPVLISFVLVGLSIVACHPAFITNFSSAIIGGAQGDGGLYVWLTADFHADPKRALSLETSALYPYPVSRAWSDSFLFPSALSHLFMVLGCSLIVAYNLTCFCALMASGLSIIALSRSLALPWVASLCAGVAFANSSYLTGNFGHPQLLYIFWVPLCWSLIIKPAVSPWRWALAGLVVAAAFHSSVYHALFCATGAVIVLALARATHKLSSRQTLRRCLSLFLGISVVTPWLPDYFAVASTFGYRSLYEATAFAASGLSYLSFSSFHPLFGSTSSWTHPEATLCAGFFATLITIVYGGVSSLRLSRNFSALLLLNLIVLTASSSVADEGNASEWLTCLAAWGTLLLTIALMLHIRTPFAVFYGLVGIFFVLSFGPGGDPMKHEPAFAPFTLFHSILPGFNAIRAVSRCGGVVVMGMYIAIAAILGRILQLGRNLPYLVVCLVTTAIVVVENYTPLFPMEVPPEAPQALSELASRRSQGEAAVVLPFAGALNDGRIKSWSHFAVLNTKYSLWAAPLQVPIVNGFSGQRSKLMPELPRALESFPSQRGMDHLGRVCGVRWVVIVPSLMDQEQRDSLKSRLASSPPYIESSNEFEDGSILLRIRPVIPVRSANSSPFYAPPSSRASLILSNPSALPCVATASSISRNGGRVVAEPFERASLGAESVRISSDRVARQSNRLFLLSLETDTCDASVECVLAGTP